MHARSPPRRVIRSEDVEEIGHLMDKLEATRSRKGS